MCKRTAVYILFVITALALSACASKSRSEKAAQKTPEGATASHADEGKPSPHTATTETEKADLGAASGASAKPADPAPSMAPPGKVALDGDYKKNPLAGLEDPGTKKKGISAAKPSRGAIATDKTVVVPPKRPRYRPRQRSGQLTAGEWRDLDHWGFWRALFADAGQTHSRWKGMEKRWGYRTSTRIPVRVRADGKPVVDASVTLSDARGKVLWTARTDNTGRAELFPSLFGSAKGPYTATVNAGAGRTVTKKKITPDAAASTIELLVSSRPQISRNVDVMFVVDTTGSMGDELEYLKSELRNVIGRVTDGHGARLPVRTSVNFYRDTTDEYVVRPFGFTRKMDTVLSQLAAQSAGGGGDFPEAVDAALHDAIHKHDWSQRARARLLFLVLDAPPHPGSKVMRILHRATRTAAAKGIRIIPVSGSGVDKPTEFLMRFLAVSTGGTYVFLTDDSGIGGSHIKPTIGPHDVKLLNALLTEIINRYVAV